MERNFSCGLLFQVVPGCLGSGKILLGDNIFAPIAWGGGFQGLFSLGTSILNPFLLGVLLGVDLLGAVRQGVQECLISQYSVKIALFY